LSVFTKKPELDTIERRPVSICGHWRKMKYFLKNRVLSAAIIKLVSNAVLVLCLHRSLKLWNYGLFGSLADTYGSVRDFLAKIIGVEIGYPLFLIGGMLFYMLLYLAAVWVIPIVNERGYVLFALICVADSLLLMYPCKELLLVMFGILLIATLRVEGPKRYVFAGILYVLVAFAVSPYLLITVPVYLCVRAWERSSRWGIWAFLLLLAVFCILYETGVLLFLLDYRPESFSGSTGFVKTFPEENYAGHVSYYVLDYLYILGRLLVPYEVFTKGNPVLIVYFFLQVASLISVFIILLGEFSVDRSSLTHSDRMRADVLTALISAYAAMAVYIPDYAAAMRMLAGLYPMFLFLYFGTARRSFLSNVAAERELFPAENVTDDSEDAPAEKPLKKPAAKPVDPDEDEDYL